MHTGTPRLNGLGARLYYAALFLCPPGFRREFSTEMARDVEAQSWPAGVEPLPIAFLEVVHSEAAHCS